MLRSLPTAPIGALRGTGRPPSNTPNPPTPHRPIRYTLPASLVARGLPCQQTRPFLAPRTARQAPPRREAKQCGKCDDGRPREAKKRARTPPKNPKNLKRISPAVCSILPPKSDCAMPEPSKRRGFAERKKYNPPTFRRKGGRRFIFILGNFFDIKRRRSPTCVWLYKAAIRPLIPCI